MRYSNLFLIAIASTSGQCVAASSTDDGEDTALMAMVDDLNDRYANGKPSGKQTLYYTLLFIYCVEYDMHLLI